MPAGRLRGRRDCVADALVDLADALDLEDVQRHHAGQLAHALTAGLAAETVGGHEFFLPGGEQ